MDYQLQLELNRKADTWKVEELQRSVDNLRRENNDLNEKIKSLNQSHQMLYEALRQTLQAFAEAETSIPLYEFKRILDSIYI